MMQVDVTGITQYDGKLLFVDTLLIFVLD